MKYSICTYVCMYMYDIHNILHNMVLLSSMYVCAYE